MFYLLVVFMISFEAMLSSILLLGAFSLLIYSHQNDSTPSQFVSFANFLELSDLAFLMSDGRACDFSNVKLDSNFCYSCILFDSNNSFSNPTTIYSSYSCNYAQSSAFAKLSINVPIYAQNKLYSMQLSKYPRN